MKVITGILKVLFLIIMIPVWFIGALLKAID